MTKLTTHCLDTFSGKPAKGVKVDVYLVSGKREKLNSIVLNNNGRSEKPLVEGANFKEGQYELVFFVGDYFRKITERFLIVQLFRHPSCIFEYISENFNKFTFRQFMNVIDHTYLVYIISYDKINHTLP